MERNCEEEDYLLDEHCSFFKGRLKEMVIEQKINVNKNNSREAKASNKFEEICQVFQEEINKEKEKERRAEQGEAVDSLITSTFTHCNTSKKEKLDSEAISTINSNSTSIMKEIKNFKNDKFQSVNRIYCDSFFLFFGKLKRLLNKYLSKNRRKVILFLKQHDEEKEMSLDRSFTLLFLILLALALFCFYSCALFFLNYYNESNYQKFLFFSPFAFFKKQEETVDFRFQLYKSAFDKFISLAESSFYEKKREQHISKTKHESQTATVNQTNTNARKSRFSSHSYLSPLEIIKNEEDNSVGVFIKKQLQSKIKAKELLFSLPLKLVLSPYFSSFFEPIIKNALEKKILTKDLAMTCHLINERRKGASSVFYSLIKSFPSISWFQVNGIFAISSDEYKIFSYGTSMEQVQTKAFEECEFLSKFLNLEDNLKFLHMSHIPVSIEEINWSYALIKSIRHFVTERKVRKKSEGEGGKENEGLKRALSKLKMRENEDWGEFLEDFDFDRNDEVLNVIIPPLYFAKQTTNIFKSVIITFNEEHECLDVLAPTDMEEGEEVYVHNPTLTDASVFLYMGVWFKERHRIFFKMPLNFQRDFELKAKENIFVSTLLKVYKCDKSSIVLSISKDDNLNNYLVSCLRLLAACERSSRVQRLYISGWFNSWPFTVPISRENEIKISQFAMTTIQHKLEVILSSHEEIKSKYGNEPIALHPLSKLREVEVDLLTQTLELFRIMHAIALDEDLFYIFKEEEEEQQRNIFEL